MLAALVLAALLPFTILKDEQGKTLMSFSKFKLPEFKLPEFNLPDMPRLPDAKNLTSPAVGAGGGDIFYKWYDAGGNVHFAILVEIAYRDPFATKLVVQLRLLKANLGLLSHQRDGKHSCHRNCCKPANRNVKHEFT